MVRAGRDGEVVSNPLWALNWRNFGKPVASPELGDVMVKFRNGGGHVTLYVGEDGEHYYGLGGNQNDQVCISKFPKHQMISFRRPAYKLAPRNIRKIYLNGNGIVANAKEA
jgi:uncharacterized protein (TIGR02594 family)